VLANVDEKSKDFFALTLLRIYMFGSEKSWQWRRMPTTVFLIGIFSIILLLWAEQVRVKQHIDDDLVDIIMDVQIHTATYHLRLEEVINGIPSADVKEATADLDRATYLVDIILNGGETEFDAVPEPPKEQELRNLAEAIKSLLIKLKEIGVERLNTPDKSERGLILERKFETIYKDVLGKTKHLQNIFEKDEAGNRAKSGRLYRAVIGIWALLVITVTVGLWNREKERKRGEDELLSANEQLCSQSEELMEHRERLAELVEKRTAELTAANALIQAEAAERLQTCEALKKTELQLLDLSSKLLRAQEIERKRISMELHDELGQALSVMKLRIRVIERGLQEDQGLVREGCEELLEYIDETIENVRRLSLDLSPTILEDLGLTSALCWLVGNFTRVANMEIISDIAEIDHLFPQNHWITIYRVMQEALTNTGKHSHAENVSVFIRRHEEKVIFSVEDDGKGFDLKRALLKNTAERGLGLATMTERVRVMGGVIDLWSQEGKGTRIVFSVPVENGEV
jgi:signal transduction histidine kinase